jgi:hypothetical protein
MKFLNDFTNGLNTLDSLVEKIIDTRLSINKWLQSQSPTAYFHPKDR